MGSWTVIRHVRRVTAIAAVLSLLAVAVVTAAPSLPNPDAFSRSTPAPRPELAPPAPAAPVVTARPKQPHTVDSTLHAVILTPALAIEPPRARIYSGDTAAPAPLPAQTAPDQPRAPPAC